MTTSPKVFISHASEDKDRFVLAFARELRGKGIDAWLDKWEMLPGDSLVDKIFCEGISNAQAIIIVLSQNSVVKPWVREEINAAFVKRINGLSKLIPVIIDDCEIPECLKSTVWERIPNLAEFDASLDKIVMAVFSQKQKPPIGPAPVYTQRKISVGSLTTADSAIFLSLCDYCVTQQIARVNAPDLLMLFAAVQIDEDQACESLEIMENRGYVELLKIQGTDIGRAGPTFFGFDEYLRITKSDYVLMFKKIAFLVVNENEVSGPNLCRSAGFPLLITHHIVRYFERKGWMRVLYSSAAGLSGFFIQQVSPELKRWLRDQ